MGHVSKIVALAKRIARDILNENVIVLRLRARLKSRNISTLT